MYAPNHNLTIIDEVFGMYQPFIYYSKSLNGYFELSYLLITPVDANGSSEKILSIQLGGLFAIFCIPELRKPARKVKMERM